MPPGSDTTRDLPEPAELHARLSRQYPLDWGEPLPSSAQIAADHGPQAMRAALTQLADLDAAADRATSQVLASTMRGASLYQLDRRIKSPQSLARKLDLGLQATAKPPREVEDLMRFTMLAASAHQLVTVAEHTVEELTAHNWRLQAVRNSYVDGSRYKGLHLDWRDPGGQRIEIQVHSPPSIAIKEATTRMYEVERDRRLPRADRDAARAECVRLSATLELPPGLDRLTSLGGCEVSVGGYGLGRRTDKMRRTPGPAERGGPRRSSQRNIANGEMDR